MEDEVELASYGAEDCEAVEEVRWKDLVATDADIKSAYSLLASYTM